MEEKNVLELYPILPLRNTILFPNQIIPIYIGRKESLNLIKDISSLEKKYIVVVAQKDGAVENPSEKDIYKYGTLATVMKIFDMPDKSKSAIVQGLMRVKVQEINQTKPYFKGLISRVKDSNITSPDINKQNKILKDSFTSIVEVAPYLNEDQINSLQNINSASKVADKVISLLNIKTEDKQTILETFDILERIKKVNDLIHKELQRLELGEKIQSEVQDEISKSQKEYYLREQLKAIQRELGEEGSGVEIEEISDKIIKAKMPTEVQRIAKKELNRLQKIPSHSPEYTVSRTYLDWLVELPWSVETKDNEKLDNANNILNKDHYGLDKVKERIIEHLAVRGLKRKRSKKGAVIKSPILCFNGPPGTGKTSMGKSIAKSMGRKFVRISLGGVGDEAEIRGHRRTYIGALPGRIIASLKKAGTNNPIFMLDEIDKLGRDFRGDPSSALLEVLDPEQNFAFNDHYLEVDFDLSNIMFITTSNRIDQVPGPLRDRMEMLDFTGYIVEEKIEIAKKHLIPKQIEEHALKNSEIKFLKSGIQMLVESYTREAGVRNLERKIANVCRKVAKKIASGDLKKTSITSKNVADFIGPKIFLPELAERNNMPGIVVGLAWTAFGGDILFIEATKMLGKGNLKLTGKLGDVMKESVQAAMSFVRSNAPKYNIDENFYKKYDIHVHVPAGAISKDGPSAGVAMTIAIISLLTNIPVKSRLGMTGETSLRGNVLPIGGLREKATAAHRAGLNHIIAPYENKKDIEEIPAKVRAELKITFVKVVDEAIKLSLNLDIN
jgi:ATP-dependent Lon protease